MWELDRGGLGYEGISHFKSSKEGVWVEWVSSDGKSAACNIPTPTASTFSTDYTLLSKFRRLLPDSKFWLYLGFKVLFVLLIALYPASCCSPSFLQLVALSPVLLHHSSSLCCYLVTVAPHHFADGPQVRAGFVSPFAAGGFRYHLCSCEERWPRRLGEDETSLLKSYVKSYSKGITIQFRNEGESRAFHCAFEQWKKEVVIQARYMISLLEKIDDCHKLILEAMDGLNHKFCCERKFESIPSSPSGVIDAYFSSNSSVDSWTVALSASSSPEPLFKRSRAQEQHMRLAPLSSMSVGLADRTN
ncbi:hypothetical protein C2S53_006344 [Perilla frutescens var. hirtella]|uniref:Probable histone-arginine methyltransferase CARM1-like N-terminal PH domain-containing protein n=1 Tax=Perilla frutescens var. hirtella TaxID=608512 RepID=A0AAD4JGN2_PERFH|nr:hypothetical protein C2S53_006344 [Perilla frutescens var. hirtella]